MTLSEFRLQKDALFRSSESPLAASARNSFQGLRYFPENASLRVVVPLIPSADMSPVTMDASSGPPRTYQRAGTVSFAVNGHQITFTVYVDTNGGYFLPFRDGTCGQESYGAGRYVEPEKLENHQLLIDFNYAYNPYCAYSHEFSCPLPSRENWTDIRIEAGEKVYD